MKVRLKKLRAIAKTVISGYGYNPAETDIIIEALLYAQMRGNNHGMLMLAGAGIPKLLSTPGCETVKQTRISALIDAHQNHPILAISQATQLVSAKATTHGLAMVGVRGIHSSSGALGYYARTIAQKNLIGFVFASSSGRVAPAGSFEPLLGTNPMAIAIPTKTEPFIIDMATSALARFGVVEAKIAGRPLPKDSAYNDHGEPTTNPTEALAGALRTFDGGYKSTGLSMMIQILAGPLVGSPTLGKNDLAIEAGHLLFAIDPELLGGTKALREGASLIIKRVKAAKRLAGTNEIVVVGERGNRHMATAQASGEVEIDDALFAELKKRAG